VNAPIEDIAPSGDAAPSGGQAGEAAAANPPRGLPAQDVPSGVAPVPVSIPAPTANADWTHRGGSVTHRVANAALGAEPQRIWSAGIGRGETRRNRISADPVVAQGRVFTLDADARVTAVGTNGAVLWSTDLTPPSDREGDASGGGLAAAEGRVIDAVFAFFERVVQRVLATLHSQAEARDALGSGTAGKRFRSELGIATRKRSSPYPAKAGEDRFPPRD